MTEFVDVPGGRIAYDENGSGPLVVLSHGIGDRRQVYRFLAPKLAHAGHRVANADLRGHGESTMGWTSITRTDVAGDLLALIGQLGGPAVLVGHSLSGGPRPSPRRPGRTWSPGSSRSTRSPGRCTTAWAGCCGSAATAGASSC